MDAAIISQEIIRDAAQSVSSIRIVVCDWFVGNVPAGHHKRHVATLK